MRAIILAAGMGTRLRPLTFDRPKSLVEVMGEPMAERQIKFLKEIGVDDITLVVGYKWEKFEYLKDKYGVNLVYNDKYADYNNIYSLYLVRDLIEDVYIIEGDIYMNKNIFEKDIKETKYFSAFKEDFQNEWKLVMDDEDRYVKEISITDGDGYILRGISYWTSEEAQKLKDKLETIFDLESFKNLYWDDLIKDNIKEFNIGVNKFNDDELFEIDCEQDLKAIEEKLNHI